MKITLKDIKNVRIFCYVMVTILLLLLLYSFFTFWDISGRIYCIKPLGDNKLVYLGEKYIMFYKLKNNKLTLVKKIKTPLRIIPEKSDFLKCRLIKTKKLNIINFSLPLRKFESKTAYYNKFVLFDSEFNLLNEINSDNKINNIHVINLSKKEFLLSSIENKIFIQKVLGRDVKEKQLILLTESSFDQFYVYKKNNKFYLLLDNGEIYNLKLNKTEQELQLYHKFKAENVYYRLVDDNYIAEILFENNIQEIRIISLNDFIVKYSIKKEQLNILKLKNFLIQIKKIVSYRKNKDYHILFHILVEEGTNKKLSSNDLYVLSFTQNASPEFKLKKHLGSKRYYSNQRIVYILNNKDSKLTIIDYFINRYRKEQLTKIKNIDL